jgi:hypothetical protein
LDVFVDEALVLVGGALVEEISVEEVLVSCD